MEDLIPIRSFAAASRLSLRALRLYDENGLLRTAHVDPESGYRLALLARWRHGLVERGPRTQGRSGSSRGSPVRS